MTEPAISIEIFLRLVRESAVRYLDQLQAQVGPERWAELNTARMNGRTLDDYRTVLSGDSHMSVQVVAECLGADMSLKLLENALAVEETT